MLCAPPPRACVCARALVQVCVGAVSADEPCPRFPHPSLCRRPPFRGLSGPAIPVPADNYNERPLVQLPFGSEVVLQVNSFEFQVEEGEREVLPFSRQGASSWFVVSPPQDSVVFIRFEP
jgi:hypothetical protein